MAGRLPPEGAVLSAAERVLRRHGTVVSLGQFLDLVRQELHREHPGAALGSARLRRLMASAPFCRMDIRTRKGPRDRVMTRCPVCLARLERVRNQTLFGGEVTLVLRCPRCPYWTGKQKRVPTLYTFHLEDGRRPTEPPEML